MSSRTSHSSYPHPHQSSSSSSSSSTQYKTRADQLTALPSLQYSLSSLPQAKSIDQVALHHSGLGIARGAESEQKLLKAIARNNSSSQNPHAMSAGMGMTPMSPTSSSSSNNGLYAPTPRRIPHPSDHQSSSPSSPSPPPLMMRAPLKPKLRT